MALKLPGILAIASALLAAPAVAQMAKDYGGTLLKESEAKAALLGIEMEGFSPTYGISWRECIQPNGQTIYETPAQKLKGRLIISPAGKACFSYEDDNFETVACYDVKKSDKGLRFEDDYNSLFITTKVVTGIKSCTRELVG
jgi:hypothetical protein